MDSAETIRLIGAFLSASVITTLLTGWQNRRKMSADAVSVLQTAASTAVQNVERDNIRLRDENVVLERHNDLLGHALRDQNLYCWRLAEEVRRLGGTVPDPPELPDEIKHY